MGNVQDLAWLRTAGYKSIVTGCGLRFPLITVACDRLELVLADQNRQARDVLHHYAALGMQFMKSKNAWLESPASLSARSWNRAANQLITAWRFSVEYNVTGPCPARIADICFRSIRQGNWLGKTKSGRGAVETWLLFDRDLAPQALVLVIVVPQLSEPLRCRHVVDVRRTLGGRI